MDDGVISVIVLVASVMGSFIAGAVFDASSIRTDCEKLGAFRIVDRVFECKEKK